MHINVIQLLEIGKEKVMDVSVGMEILERNDDLLSEILLRLPSRSIFKFTCVSRRWNEAIMDPLFKKLYRERAGKTYTCSHPHGRLLAMVQTNNKYASGFDRPSKGLVHNFLPVIGEDVGAARCGREFFPTERGYFITSSKDGLVLCGDIPKIYYVGSPITGNWETLPQPPEPFPGCWDWETQTAPRHGRRDYSLSVGLSSNEDDDTLGGKIINFRVVVATGCTAHYREDPLVPGSKVIPIQTYSSRTREWRRSELLCNIHVILNNFVPPIFSGGFLHWIPRDNEYIVAYDPSLLDEEDDDNCDIGSVPRKKQHQHVVQLIKTPYNGASPILWRSDNGQTIWYGVSGMCNGVHIFQKRDDSDEWACISRLAPPNALTMTRPTNALTRNMLGITQADIDKERALCGLNSYDEGDEERSPLSMIAFIPWDPKLVLVRHWDRIYVYDCKQNKLDHEVLLDGDCHVTICPWDWYPLFHTISKSPYNLKYDHHPQTESR